MDSLDRFCRSRGWRLGLEGETSRDRFALTRLVVKRKGGEVVAAGLLGYRGHRSIDRVAEQLLAELDREGGAS